MIPDDALNGLRLPLAGHTRPGQELHRRLTLRCWTGLLLAVLSSGTAAAPSHPDLSGYWELRYDSFNVPQASVTPGTLAGQAAQIRHDIDAVRWCDPIGMPAIMGDRAPIDLRQSASVIGIV